MHLSISRLILVFSLGLLCGSCGDQARFETVDDSNEFASEENALPEEPAEDVETETPPPIDAGGVANLCSDAARLQRHTQEVRFPNPGKTCAWQQDGNLGPVDRVLRARFEQDVKLSLPDGALVCSLELRFPEQDMFFDDEIFLSYNDVILAASADYSSILNQKDGLVFYDWEILRDAPYDPLAKNPYCLGEGENLGTCAMPYTETQGDMELVFNPGLFHRITALTAGVTPHFSFVTTGDNNVTDCQHSDFEFSAVVGYVLEAE